MTVELGSILETVIFFLIIGRFAIAKSFASYAALLSSRGGGESCDAPGFLSRGNMLIVRGYLIAAAMRVMLTTESKILPKMNGHLRFCMISFFILINEREQGAALRPDR